MSYEMDMSQYMDLFIQESGEQLSILESEMLKLEKEPTNERLQVIFRAAHTLKGSARAMSFTNFADLTHEMENVLDQLRNGALALSTEITDGLLEVVDSLNSMSANISEGKGDPAAQPALISKLTGFLDSAKATSVPSAPTSAAPASAVHLTDSEIELLQTANAETAVWHGHFKLDSECAMKFVRAFMVINEIQKQGEILVCWPDSESLEEEKFESEFEIYFQTTEEIEPLKARLATVSELVEHVVIPFAAAPAAQPKDEAALNQASEPTAVKSAAKSETGQTVRVDVARLDQLMNLVGELVIDRTRIAQIGMNLSNQYDDPNVHALTETVSHIHRITSALQDQIMKARMMPIESVFNRFPRVVRDLANKLDKKIELNIEGGETELDRSVIEVIGDPILHILRNSVDHGIETEGAINLTARHKENHIVIDIEDNGRGINAEMVKQKAVEKGLITADAASRMAEREALQLIFASGLSTAKQVSDVSGRGVGMDIVRSNIQKLGGIIEIESTVGVGTKISLRLPLTLAIIRGLLVRSDSNVYVIPLGSVIETMSYDQSQVEQVSGRDVIVIRGMTTPLVELSNVFKSESRASDSNESDQKYVVIVGLAEQRVGVVVDGLIGEREVVIKSLSRYCGDISGICGATILGDGNVALILDVNGMVASQAA